MDRDATERVALMAIHPKYADAIMDGEKAVEFRKRRLADDIREVWVYATAPVSQVIGKFVVEEIVESDPNSIWKRFGAHGVIGRDDFFDYYEGSTAAVAIVVAAATRFTEPFSLGDIDPKPAVPQSFAYIAPPSRELAYA